MKNLLVVLFITTLSFQASAFRVSKSKLLKVNNFISQELIEAGVDTKDVTVKITKASTKLFSKKLKSINVQATFEDSFVAEGKIKISSNKISVGAKISGLLSQRELDSVNDLLPLVEEYIEMFDENENFDIALSVESNKDGKNVYVVVTPSEDNGSFKKSTLKVFLPKYATHKLSADVNFVASAKDETVNKAQVALTNIFADLVMGNTPSDDDYEALGEAVETALSSIL